jgi:release factor glutamine methyltransferase
VQTIDKVLVDAKDILQRAKVDNSALDARLLLQFVLAMKHEELLCHSKRILTAEEQKRFLILISKRAQRQPLSHLIGKREFWRDEFIVSEAVLDPRADSETLIEVVINLFPQNAKLNILDLGTGSGCLLLSLLRELPNAQGIGGDVSEAALMVAKQNAENLLLANRVEFTLSNWFDNLKDRKFDLIISNPPYIPTEDIKILEPEIHFEPITALDGGIDGLDDYRAIADRVGDYLLGDGKIIVEIGIGQENYVRDIFSASGLCFLKEEKDLAGVIRCLVFDKGTPSFD